MFPDPATSGSIPGIPEFFSEETVINVAEVNQRCWFEENEQWLENVDRTHYNKNTLKLGVVKRHSNDGFWMLK